MSDSMKRLILYIILFVLTSCMGPGLNDYAIDLPNNYAIVHVNPNNIIIGYKSTKSTLSIYNNNKGLIGIEPFIVAYYSDERYVCAKRISQSNIASYKSGFDVEIHYYFLDTLKKKVLGPFGSEKELSVECNYSSLIDWIQLVRNGERPAHQ
jgi:hypothetical protein